MSIARFCRLAITAEATVLTIDYRVSSLQHEQHEPVTTPTFGTFAGAREIPATLEIVPSPVIDTNGEFFFGTGDGSAGYYAECPNQ